VTTAGPSVTNVAGGGRTVNLYNNINSAITITGQAIGGNKQNPFLKYAAKIGTGNSQLKYQIICTSCVIDFK